MKVIELPPLPESAESKLNKRMLAAHRSMKQAFVRPKAGFVFCKKNSFWNDLDFVKMGIEASCGLNIFLEQRLIQLPEVDRAQLNENELPQAEDRVDGQGVVVRDTLVQWVSEH
jgi:hypothetical protein